MTEFIAIIVAAGTGTRFGTQIPKQYAPLHGKPVLRHSIDAFLRCADLKDIRIVIHPDHEDLYRRAVKGLALPEPVHGGATRQDSVRLALESFANIPNEMPVLIHDAARPCVGQAAIENCIIELQTSPAVTLAIPVADTLRKTQNGILRDGIPREHLYALQTPQGFHFNIIKSAHEKFKVRSGFTDDTMLVSENGVPVKIIEGARSNIKITTEDDFKMIEKLMAQSKITKTGIGYDVHAFGEESSSIRIGGIDIPHTHKLAGHSDADVVLHAITDALYGTISSGDIGSHFPPSDNSFKNMDSEVFFKDAVAAIIAASGKIIHIDTITICEAPKIGPYRDKIRERIAQICEIHINSVSVKATTSEGLGFTGRREGIAAQALVTIEFTGEFSS